MPGRKPDSSSLIKDCTSSISNFVPYDFKLCFSLSCAEKSVFAHSFDLSKFDLIFSIFFFVIQIRFLYSWKIRKIKLAQCKKCTCVTEILIDWTTAMKSPAILWQINFAKS